MEIELQFYFLEVLGNFLLEKLVLLLNGVDIQKGIFVEHINDFAFFLEFFLDCGQG